MYTLIVILMMSGNITGIQTHQFNTLDACHQAKGFIDYGNSQQKRLPEVKSKVYAKCVKDK